jgi:hypothetical protein
LDCSKSNAKLINLFTTPLNKQEVL